MADSKGLLIIVDGLGDRSCPELGGQTPLEAASTPRLDRLAEQGISGLVDPLYPGVPVGTHTGTGALMGLAPRDAALLARGPVEAAGIELPVGPGDVLLRCNFATLSFEQGRIQIADRRAGRIREGTHELAAVLQDLPLGDGITASLYPTTQHRAVLALRGPGLSAEVTDTDPGSGREALGALPASARDAGNAAALRTADAVNHFVHEAHRLLAAHPVNAGRNARGLPPANGILTRSAGVAGSLRNLVSYLGLKASVITGEQTVAGLGRLFGFRIVSGAGFTALPQTDLAGKWAAAVSELETSDLVFLHIKGPDICSHDRDPLGKKANLECIDAMLSDLRRDDLVIGVTGDHSSDSNRGRHCGDPVPCLLVTPNGRRDVVKRFDEAACMTGGLGRISATAFLITLLDGMAAIGNFRPADTDHLFV
ncbi:MAG: alkaline phosphatase family protein [Gammaproteobacteria bacterium]|nr:alkaline phosphatase family protein [Gammaproteobacteria bacterium]